MSRRTNIEHRTSSKFSERAVGVPPAGCCERSCRQDAVSTLRFIESCLTVLVAIAFAATGSGAEVDISKLPAPANGKIEFNRDVRPILESSCLRCHGPEKPKSHFRLDNRESALKGGYDNPDDIIPGDSAHSHLIHYVAGIDPDVEMPPEGRGERLMPQQIAVLRAWIDQGANWGSSNAYPELHFTVSPALRWVDVHGDQSKFRELNGTKEGWGGGVDEFTIQEQLSPDKRVSAEGHVFAPDNDYRLKLSLEKTDLGFIRGGFEEWRRYYDDTGGYYRPYSPPAFSLNRDLHLDVGRAWVDFGWTRPHLPQVMLGYEFQFKNGTKSMLEWGAVNDKNIYPASKEIDEQTHILKIDAVYKIHDWHLENNARGEFYTDNTVDRQSVLYTTGPAPDALARTAERSTHTQASDTFRVERQIRDWWFCSAGYLYSRFDGDFSANQSTLDAQGSPTLGTYWNADQITLRRQFNAFSVASLFKPAENLMLSVGAQPEFSHQEGFGDISLDAGDPNVPGLFVLQPARVRSDLDEVKTMENADLRYTKIPFTVLFTEGRFEQDNIGQSENETGTSPDDFMRHTDYANRVEDVRTGFSTSPWRWFDWNAHYRWRDSDTDYNNVKDESLLGGLGYSAFLRHRAITSDEVETKLVLHPVTWLKSTLTFRRTESDFHTATDPVNDPFFGIVSRGGSLLGGRSEAFVYGLDLTFIPSQRFYITGGLTYTRNRTWTWADGAIPTVVVPYDGGIYSAVLTANLALNAHTSCQASYALSLADVGQNNVADGLPLGLNYTRHTASLGITRQLTKNLSANVRYRFDQYSESSTGGFNNYTANGIFAVLSYRWL